MHSPLSQIGATVITANAIAHPATIINTSGSIFHLTNSHPLTCIPFCRKMPLHNNPAKLAENTKLTAPILLPIARASIPAAFNFDVNPCLATKVGCLRTLTSRIVAPMLVPEQLQRKMEIRVTKKIVAGMEKATTRASQDAKRVIQPV